MTRIRKIDSSLVIEGFESGLGLVWYILLAVLPVAAWIFRFFGGSDIPYQSELVYQLVVMLTALAGSYTENHNEHLSIDLGLDKSPKSLARALVLLRDLFGSFLLIQLFMGSMEFLLVAVPENRIWFISVRFFVAFLPLGFAGIIFHWLRRLFSRQPWWAHLLAMLLGVLVALPSLMNIIYSFPGDIPAVFPALENLWYAVIPPIIPVLVILLILLTATGLPLYLVLSGISTLLFLGGGVGPAIVINEGYSFMNNAAVPAIALFTLTGFILSESKASARFIEAFLAFFGWMPGGMVIVAIFVSAVFTSFTAASGVTILALGGLLYKVLHDSGRYSERFTIGVLTSSGSVGLLFIPSLAIILYGSVAGINIKSLFLAGILPGILMVLSRVVFGVGISLKSHNPPVPFEPKRALKALKDVGWELMIPVIVILLIFSGWATLLETSAFALIYTLIVETFIKKEIKGRMLFLVVMKSMRVIGGVLMILMLAQGLRYYLVDAQIPQNLTAFVRDNIHSPLLFLLLLNVVLLVTGALMDIFSAIFVIVPLILPLGELFGINPIHLGIIFLANLELGFITPPVGMNLFLSSYRFHKGLHEVYRSILPFLLLQLLVVLIITFVPWLSLVFVK